MGRHVSAEGVLLFVRRLSMSVDDWVQLLALSTELGRLRLSLNSMASSELQLDITAGWLHRRRRRVLRSVCCSTEQHRDDMLDTCQQKLTQYR